MMNETRKKPKKLGLILLLLAAALGIILIIYGEVLSSKIKTVKSTDKIEYINETLETLSYIEKLENKIVKTVNGITGHGDASVIIGISKGIETIYATDSETNSGGDSSNTHVTVKSADGDTLPITVIQHMPELIGVSVACSGGDTANIQKKVVDIISNSLGISSNRVTVVGTE